MSALQFRSDYERIVTEIAERFAFFGGSQMPASREEAGKKRQMWHEAKTGDVVRVTCLARSLPFTFGWYKGTFSRDGVRISDDGVTRWGGDYHLIRKFGTEETCRVRNAGLWSIPGYKPLEGHQYHASRFARRAVYRSRGRFKFAGVEFPDRHSRVMVVKVRLLFSDEHISLPAIHWTTKTRQRDLITMVEAMWDQATSSDATSLHAGGKA